MKQFLLLIAILLLSTVTYSQINIKDSLVQSIAYWIKNDEVKYNVDYEWYNIKDNDTLNKLTKQNELKIKVIDSTAISYDVEWIYKRKEIEPSNPHETFRIVFRTDEFGSFKEWLNKEEVLKELKRNNFPDFIQVEKNIISTLIIKHITHPNNEIFDFLTPYILYDVGNYLDYFGGSYSMTNYEWGNVEIYNPINKKNMNYAVVVEVEDVFEEDNLYIISSTTNPNQENLKSFMGDVFKVAIDKNDFNVEIHNRSIFHNSGWLLESFTTRNISYKNETNIKNTYFNYLPEN